MVNQDLEFLGVMAMGGSEQVGPSLISAGPELTPSLGCPEVLQGFSIFL